MAFSTWIAKGQLMSRQRHAKSIRVAERKHAQVHAENTSR